MIYDLFWPSTALFLLKGHGLVLFLFIFVQMRSAQANGCIEGTVAMAYNLGSLQLQHPVYRK
jgi:hypothetical protein